MYIYVEHNIEIPFKNIMIDVYNKKYTSDIQDTFIIDDSDFDNIYWQYINVHPTIIINDQVKKVLPVEKLLIGNNDDIWHHQYNLNEVNYSLILYDFELDLYVSGFLRRTSYTEDDIIFEIPTLLVIKTINNVIVIDVRNKIYDICSSYINNDMYFTITINNNDVYFYKDGIKYGPFVIDPENRLPSYGLIIFNIKKCNDLLYTNEFINDNDIDRLTGIHNHGKNTRLVLSHPYKNVYPTRLPLSGDN